MIVIFSTKMEFGTDRVMEWLHASDEEVIRINGDENRFKLQYIDNKGIYVNDGETNKTYDLYGAKSCWFRRHGMTNRFLNYSFSKFRNRKLFDDTVNDEYLKSHLDIESQGVIEFMYRRVETSAGRCLGSFFKRNLNRLEIFDLAGSHGFRVPAYWVATDHARIGEIAEDHQVVTKAISNGVYNIIGKKRFYTYTEKIDTQTLMPDQLQEKVFPTLLLQQIKKRFEVRTFYMLGKFYSMAIFSQGNPQTEVDFRKYSQSLPNRTEPFLLPSAVAVKLEALFQSLGLNTGSADMIVDEDGEYVFLEINPVGQFGMVSLPCNYGLEEKIAKYLSYGAA